MTFYIVFVKNRKKFDKYVKVNRLKNKVIIDIKEQLEENQIKDKNKYKHYFNLMIFNKIKQSINKNKDIYYIPNFDNDELDINELIELKKFIESIHFNILLFYDEFKNDLIINDIINILDEFDSSQIIRDY